MISLVQPSDAFQSLCLSRRQRIGEQSPGRPICGTSPMDDGLACWGLLDGPGGSRKEGRKEGRKGSGREVPRVGIYKRISRCQEPS